MSLKCHLKVSEQIAVTSYRKNRVQIKSLDLIDFPIFLIAMSNFFYFSQEKTYLRAKSTFLCIKKRNVHRFKRN